MLISYLPVSPYTYNNKGMLIESDILKIATVIQLKKYNVVVSEKKYMYPNLLLPKNTCWYLLLCDIFRV